MSSDNSIVILQTKKGSGHEYRVAHLLAVDNYSWDNKKKKHTNNPQIQIKNAREMWSGCKVYDLRSRALQEADRIYQEILKDDFCPIVEYGICFIEIDAEF